MQEFKKKKNIMNIKNLEITRRIVQVITIVASVGLALLVYFTPWSQETVIHYNLFRGLAYFLPMIGLLVINGSVKRYFKRRVKDISTIRISPVETASVMQSRSEIQQSKQKELENWKRSMLQLRRRLGF